MIGFGLFTEGFLRPRMPEILADIAADLRVGTGQDFDLSPDSLTGQFVTVFADREAALWEQLEQVYFAMYPLSATGAALDEAVAFSGARRIQERRGAVTARMTASPGVTLPAGIAARANGDDTRDWLLVNDVTFNAATAAGGRFRVDTLAPSIVINGASYAGAGATVSLAAQSLSATLNTARPGIASVSAAVVTVAIPVESALTFVDVTPLALDRFGAFVSSDFAASALPANVLTRIQGSVPGWVAINNDLAGTSGRARETDAELRSRYGLGVSRLGSGTASSLRANLEEVDGVLRVRIFDNDTNLTDADGRPGHSFETIVTGGTDADVASLIWRMKPIGPGTYGNTGVSISDDFGIPRFVLFTRPVPRIVWVRLTVTRYTEEPLTPSHAARVATAVSNWGNALQPGEDVLMQRVLGPVFASVEGLRSVAVELAYGTAGAPGTYGAVDLAIGVREDAAFDASRVTVIGP